MGESRLNRGRWSGSPPYAEATAVLASMHGKALVMAPQLRALGIEVAPAGIDTDRFGTFSRELPRAGSPADAARAKIAAAFAQHPAVQLALASEGSFGPHPLTPLLPYAHELVLFIDREHGLELWGEDRSTVTNFAHTRCRDGAAAMAFAARIGFPGHGLIALGCVDGQPTPAAALVKDFADAAALAATVERIARECGEVFVETDMRADRNPTRMAAIARATVDLVSRFGCRCPACDWPGYAGGERVPGLPCAACGAPTALARALRVRCVACGASEERRVAAPFADPARCHGCNP